MNIGILIPDNIPKVIAEVMKFLDLGLNRPAIIHQGIAEVVEVGQVLPDNFTLVIAEDMLIEADLVHKRPATITISIREHELILRGEAYIGLRPATITPITNVNMLDC